MTDSEINHITDLIVHKVYNKGEMIVHEEESVEGLIIINTGKAKGYRNSSEGKEQILYLYTEGDFFGEKYLLVEETAHFNVQALEGLHVCMIMKKDFQNLVKLYPSIGFKIMEELSRKLERLETTIEQMGNRSVEVRVMGAIIEFTKKFSRKTSKGLLVELPLNREGIANYIGVTRETVSRCMNALQSDHIIELVGNKRIIVYDLALLEEKVK